MSRIEDYNCARDNINLNIDFIQRMIEENNQLELNSILKDLTQTKHELDTTIFRVISKLKGGK